MSAVTRLGPGGYPVAAVVTGPGGASGTLAATDGADIAAGSGAILIQGTIAATDRPDNPSISGGVLVKGALAATDRPDVFAAAAKSIISGTLAATDRPDVSAIAGKVFVKGDLAAIDGPDHLSAVAGADSLGMMAATEGADILAAAGIHYFAADMAATEGADTAEFAGVLPISGTFDSSEGPDRFESSGTRISKFVGYLVCAAIEIKPALDGTIELLPEILGAPDIRPEVDATISMRECTDLKPSGSKTIKKKYLHYGDPQQLGFLPGGGAIPDYWDRAECISGDGRVAVVASKASDGQFHIARWTEETGLVDLGVVDGGTYSTIGGAAKPGCSYDGSIIVGRADGFGGTGYSHQHAIKWTQGGGFIDLGTIAGATFTGANACSADGSVIACFTNHEPAFWTEATGFQILNSLTAPVYGNAFCVSADGESFGGNSGDSNGVEVGVVWRGPDADPIDVGTLWTPKVYGYVGSDVFALSSDGSIAVGGTRIPDVEGQSRWQGFRWTETGGMVTLGDSALYMECSGCNATGSIVVGTVRPSPYPATDSFAFVYQNSTGLVRLEGNNAQAMNISADGKAICGEVDYGGGNIGPVIWRAV